MMMDLPITNAPKYSSTQAVDHTNSSHSSHFGKHLVSRLSATKNYIAKKARNFRKSIPIHSLPLVCIVTCLSIVIPVALCGLAVAYLALPIGAALTAGAVASATFSVAPLLLGALTGFLGFMFIAFYDITEGGRFLP